jgi:[ribosomal protein S18]-alanine N-acetyltransferase
MIWPFPSLSSSPDIRLLATRDAPFLVSLHAQGFAHGWDGPEFERLLVEPSSLGHGVFLSKSAIPSGFVLSRFVHDEAEILTLVLARSCRGRGLSSLLMKTHIEALERFGVACVHLEVNENNIPALALYKALGFVVTGCRPAYYTDQSPFRSDALTMTRRV